MHRAAKIDFMAHFIERYFIMVEIIQLPCPGTTTNINTKLKCQIFAACARSRKIATTASFSALLRRVKTSRSFVSQREREPGSTGSDEAAAGKRTLNDCIKTQCGHLPSKKFGKLTAYLDDVPNMFTGLEVAL